MSQWTYNFAGEFRLDIVFGVRVWVCVEWEFSGGFCCHGRNCVCAVYNARLLWYNWDKWLCVYESAVWPPIKTTLNAKQIKANPKQQHCKCTFTLPRTQQIQNDCICSAQQTHKPIHTNCCVHWTVCTAQNTIRNAGIDKWCGGDFAFGNLFIYRAHGYKWAPFLTLCGAMPARKWLCHRIIRMILLYILNRESGRVSHVLEPVQHPRPSLVCSSHVNRKRGRQSQSYLRYICMWW